MHFNQQSKPAYVKIIRTKFKAQMGDLADGIDAFSDDKIIEMQGKWRQRLIANSRAAFTGASQPRVPYRFQMSPVGRPAPVSLTSVTKSAMSGTL